MPIEKYVYVSVQHPFTYMLFRSKAPKTQQIGLQTYEKNQLTFCMVPNVVFSSRNDFSKLAPSQKFSFLYNSLIKTAAGVGKNIEHWLDWLKYGKSKN